MTIQPAMTAGNDAVIEKLRKQFADDIVEISSFRDEITVGIRAEALIPICRFLRDEKELVYNFLMDLTSVDYPECQDRFAVVYHLYSLQYNRRLRLKVRVGGDNPSIESVTPVWKSANWMEREVYDLMGVHFRGHPDLRRIVLPDDWEGHPLRKDYPLRGPET
jgi:NADH-quinone oxidoreductase subunit C